jgi:hypothetical protein
MTNTVLSSHTFSLGLHMLIFQPQKRWKISNVFQVSHSSMKNHQVRAGWNLANLCGPFHSLFIFSSKKIKNILDLQVKLGFGVYFGNVRRWLDLSPCFDTIEAVSPKVRLEFLGVSL